MASYANGDRSAIPPSKQIFIPTLVIKRDSVEAFTTKINGLRGKNALGDEG
ncbi:MAG: hypothetical protein WKF84_23130 [Pyrinomonadaceae bacterium]